MFFLFLSLKPRQKPHWTEFLFVSNTKKRSALARHPTSLPASKPNQTSSQSHFKNTIISWLSTIIKTVFHYLVEGFHYLANTPLKEESIKRVTCCHVCTGLRKRKLKKKMQIKVKATELVFTLTMYERAEVFVLKCKNVLPKWNISSEVLKGTLLVDFFFFCFVCLFVFLTFWLLIIRHLRPGDERFRHKK